jgi:hypothetical protein
MTRFPPNQSTNRPAPTDDAATIKFRNVTASEIEPRFAPNWLARGFAKIPKV